MIRHTISTILFAAVAASPAMAAQGNVTFEVPATSVTSIDAGCGVKVIYTQSPSTKVTVSTPSEVKPYLKVSVRNGELKATLDDKRPMKINGSKVTVTVQAPMVTDFEASSSASITVASALNAPGRKVEIEASSASDITFRSISASKMDVEASSAGSVKITGIKTTTLDAEASSASELTLSGIEAERVTAESSSASEIKLQGKAGSGQFEASSASSIDAARLICSRLSVDSSSGGSVKAGKN